MSRAMLGFLNETNGTEHEAALGLQTPAWGVWTLGAGIMAVQITVCLPCVCCGVLRDNARRADQKKHGDEIRQTHDQAEMAETMMTSDASDDAKDDPAVMALEDVRKQVKTQLQCVLAFPWLCALVLGAVIVCRGEGASTYTSWAIFLLAVGFSMFLEITLLKKIQLDPTKTGCELMCDLIWDDLWNFPTSPFIMSKLELVDAASDGAALAAIAYKEATSAVFHARVVYAWANGGAISRALLPVVGVCGVTGFLALSLLSATMTQHALMQLGEDDGGTLEADLAGLGALAEAHERRKQSRGFSGENKEEASIRRSDPNRIMLATVARILGERLLQVFWQTSALMATGQSLREQPMLLASLVISIGTMMKKAFDFLRFACPLVGVVMLFPLLFCATRIAMTDLCPEHAWNFAWPPMSGCVDFPSAM